jgi:hypothetical protein
MVLGILDTPADLGWVTIEVIDVDDDEHRFVTVPAEQVRGF